MGMPVVSMDSRIHWSVDVSSTSYSVIHSLRSRYVPPIRYVTFTLSPYTSLRRCRTGSRPHDHQHIGSAKCTISIGGSTRSDIRPSPHQMLRAPFSTFRCTAWGATHLYARGDPEVAPEPLVCARIPSS